MTFTNPVHDHNFPDPGALRVGDVYYVYGTNDGVHNVPLLISMDLVEWTLVGDALPELGRWAESGRTWAPEVLRTDSGYVMYYTARSPKDDLQCLGLAVSTSPGGPFVDTAERPFIAQTDEGGSIDASPFTDADGQVYLHWKNDGNHVGVATHLYGQRLSSDGRELLGEPVRLLTNREPWHGHVIEAPQMFLRDGQHYLFYSAGAFDSDGYAVGYARCDSPLGPVHDAPENPILTSGPGAAGPGHCSIVIGPDGDSTWMLYHAWPPDAIGSGVSARGRRLWLDRVEWRDGSPVVHGPTANPQPEP
ncbi:glycoside hydrolase family 43 protein [Stackebrandtia nassauensis]|uniref:Glycoside hydrolase family 43 n=1 Tax=Stackebrandtia nassauensis (strain DSM 44728 / CIP 108903 / NRRL B-16338 / NBRC 102104 / LLR-40K-21) TaxID=446470 RepID=D3Q1S7_STANL|nr:glycoside hydrolase family 43 protein [Stackebrandtia nassauensis]ADD39925.1 glycoside hydrolase family 43 [Stackebrandtia nassauensis DSM 44728]